MKLSDRLQGILAGAIMLGVPLTVLMWNRSREADKALMADAARALILPQQVEITDTVQDGDEIAARVRNLSPRYTLTSVKFKVTVVDSLPEGGSEIVGTHTQEADVLVPPSQARKLNLWLLKTTLPRPVGPRSWVYSILSTTGRISGDLP